MKSIQYSVCFLLFVAKIQAQTNYSKVWINGGYNVFKTTFNSFGLISDFVDSNYHYYFGGGHSNICNANGELQFLSNGYFLFDKNLQLLENGDSMVHSKLIIRDQGFSNYSQASIILPFLGNKYYLFTPTASDFEVQTYWNVPMSGRALFDELLYHVIDMNVNGGLGKVIRKKVPLLQNVRLSKTNMMACKHGNGIDYWLFKQGHDSNYVYKFLVTKDSIYDYGIQDFPGFRFGKWDQGGQAMFSKDGKKYAVCIRGGGQTISINPPPVAPGKFFVADFDRCNGMLSNPTYYQTKPSSCQNPFDTTCMENFTEGLCFSPNGRFLYIASYYSIKQLDLWDSDTATQWSYIHGLDTTWDATQGYSSIYLGPDDKMYIGNWSGLSKQMSVINNPNNKGITCNFCPRCLRFPDYGASAPPCMAHYELGSAPIGGNCWPLAMDNSENNNNDFAVYPNPGSDMITIFNSAIEEGSLTLEFFDMVGALKQKCILVGLKCTYNYSTSNLQAGIYNYRFSIDGRLRKSGKWVKQN